MNDEERLRALMLSYQLGSPVAFDELYGRLAPALQRYLLGFYRDRALAEELLQDTFLQLHRSRHTYRPDAPLKPWAFAIARHVALMHRRAADARPKLEPTGDVDPATDETGLDDAADVRHRVSRALAELPKDGRRVVVLHHVLGFSFEEIASRLRIRTGAAKVRASRGRAALRALLGEKK